MKPKLFLLKPDFKDDLVSPKGYSYFCSDCAVIDGGLNYYPRLRNDLEIYYVDFERPRKEIVKLIGKENQSCPVLIVSDNETEFFNTNTQIIGYLSKKYGIGMIHP
jgi:predicted GTPase